MRCGVFEGKLVDPLDSGFDEAENLLPAIAGGGGGLEDDGFAGAEFLHGFGEEADVFFDELGFDLVGFGEDEGEGEFVLDKPLDELEIEFLRGVAGVDEDEGAAEVLPFDEVFGDELVELVAHFFGDFGVAVSGEVDEGPVVVDFEEINFAGAARGFGDSGEAVLVGEQVDERRLADIGPSDKCEFRKLGRRAFG